MYNSSQAAVRTAFRHARQASRARHREIAADLGISEGELIAAHCGPCDRADSPLEAVRLCAEWPGIVGRLQDVGELMALTRNAWCVHEKVGVYAHPASTGGIGMVHGGAIDLRAFYAHWAHGFAVAEHLPDGSRQRSLQFFDRQGRSIHKTFLRPASDPAAFDALVRDFTATFQTPAGISVLAPEPPVPEPADATVDVAGLRQAWASLRDTHAFAGLLETFGVSRRQALRLADPVFATPVAPGSLQNLLVAAARGAVPIMVFVANPGMIQIHTGPVHRVETGGGWLNVLDPDFNLHVREDRIAQAWVVKKPTRDGLVQSLELFDATGDTVAMLFGARVPGEPERGAWRRLLATACPEVATCAG